jgi:hypothetical protein
MNHESVMSAVQSGLAELVGVPGNRVIILSARMVSTRRLQGTSEDYYALAIEYALVVDSAEGSAVTLENAVESLNATQLAASVNAELARSERAYIEIGVKSIAAPVSVNYLPSATVTSTTATSTSKSLEHLGATSPPAGPAMGQTSISIAVAVAVFVFASVVGICYFGCRARREQNSNSGVHWFLDLEEQKPVSASKSMSSALDIHSLRIADSFRLNRILVV